MKTSIALIALTFLVSCTCSETQKDKIKNPHPKLTAVIVVDQMRADELERYDKLWRYGFRRLLDKGRVYTEARHGHARTETAAGHAVISTGLHPRYNGVPDKRVFDLTHKKTMHVCDFGEPPCGPGVLRAATLGDR
ncbi:alkaline phosphatase family protein, partial [Myxococcota bacterium]|nr:alkaline phosphatase family protein [Myxococcota bacterium]